MQTIQDYQNVREQWYLMDTICIGPYVDTLPHAIPGWFSSFANFAAADSHTFFDSRNKGMVGLAYNNQESRDQLPYALVAESLSISFIPPAISTHLGDDGSVVRGRTDVISSFWENEVPSHTSAIFRTNQDERLKTNVAMLPAGYGAVGSSFGQGDISLNGGQSGSVTTGGMGRAHLKYRWRFPGGIGIPKRATTSVEIRLVEWARTVIGSMWGPGVMAMRTYDEGGVPETPNAFLPTMFMIQCVMTGRREVQQRGEYHA